MDQQNARSMAIKKKVQERYEVIRKKEEEFEKRREKVRVYHNEIVDLEFKSIEPRLTECYGKLFASEDKA